MDILVPYSWLKDYLKTDLSVEELARLISLHGPAIEKWKPTDDGDTVFDIEVTTNRIDASSMIGMARECHAILTYNKIDSTLKPLTAPAYTEYSIQNTEYSLDVDVDHDLCPRFTAIIVDNVKVGPSPKEIVDRLEKVGERGINNIVDITNYVMYETGQPMHVFDYDKIAGHKMKLRASRAGEKVKTLDGVERTVPEGAIVIEDAEKLIDLAGIMGGHNSMVDDTTKRVVLFVQTYNPHVIRKTSMAMAHRSEASSRFEKGLDTENVLPALECGLELLVQNASATVASKLIDIYPKPYQPKTVTVSQNQIDTMIGVSITLDQAAEILTLLGFQIAKKDDRLEALVPSYRADDIDNAYDLIEEIARMYGYHNIPSKLPTGEIPTRPDNLITKREKQVKIALKYLGWTEVFTNSATSEAMLKKMDEDPAKAVKIKNPLTEDFVYMRTRLLQTVLPVVAENLPRFPDQHVFELSKIYKPGQGDLPQEIRMLQLVTTDTDLLKLKGIIEQLLDELGIKGITVEPLSVILNEREESSAASNAPVAARSFVNTQDDNTLDAFSGAAFVHNDKEIGHIGLLAPRILQNYDIAQPLATAKLFFDDLVALATDAVQLKPIPKYPALIEDISFVVAADQSAGPILTEVKNLDALITNVDVIDVYTGSGVGEGKKSLTLRITYQDPEKLLSDADVAPIRDKIHSKLTNNFSADLRSK